MNLFLSTPINLLVRLRSCEIYSVHTDRTTGVAIELVSIKEQYCWDFMSVTSLSNTEDIISQKMSYPYGFNYFSISSSLVLPESWVQKLCCIFVSWSWACPDQLIFAFWPVVTFCNVLTLLQKKKVFFIIFWMQSESYTNQWVKR